MIKIKKLNEESRLTFLSIGGGLLVFFIVFMGVLYLFHRRNVQRIRLLKQAKKVQTNRERIESQHQKNLTETLLINEQQL